MFTQQERLRNHYVGQQLLRLALRRRSERAIKQELLEHTGDKRVYVHGFFLDFYLIADNFSYDTRFRIILMDFFIEMSLPRMKYDF